MTTPEDVYRIKHMSFRELREELAECVNNPVRELLIRKMMKRLYLEHQEKKRRLNNERKMMVEKNIMMLKKYESDINK